MGKRALINTMKKKRGGSIKNVCASCRPEDNALIPWNNGKPDYKNQMKPTLSLRRKEIIRLCAGDSNARKLLTHWTGYKLY